MAAGLEISSGEEGARFADEEKGAGDEDGVAVGACGGEGLFKGVKVLVRRRMVGEVTGQFCGRNRSWGVNGAEEKFRREWGEDFQDPGDVLTTDGAEDERSFLVGELLPPRGGEDSGGLRIVGTVENDAGLDDFKPPRPSDMAESVADAIGAQGDTDPVQGGHGECGVPSLVLPGEGHGIAE